MRILITRPEIQGERTAALLRARGHDVLHVPLLRVETITDVEIGPGPWTAVAMTSANAARAIFSHRRKNELTGLPAFVVGERTQEAARTVGFTHVTSAHGGVNELSQLMREQVPKQGTVLYLAGEDRAGDLAGSPSGAGYAVDLAVVYRAVAETALPEVIARALKADAIDAVLHFSRRSAAILLRLAQEASCLVNILKYKHFCLSQGVVEPLALAGAVQIFVAARPDEAALLELIGID